MLSVLSARTALAAALLASLSACSGAGDEPPLGRARSRIYQGDPSGPEDDAVVEVLTAGSQLPCTGTLVADNLVVTARHCVAYVAPGSFECDTNGELVSLADAGKVGTSFAPSSISIFAGSTPVVAPAAYGRAVLGTDAPSVCRDDLAFVVLDRALDFPIRPIRIFDPIWTGERVTIVGFGAGASSGGRHRSSSLPVLSVGPDEPDPSDTSLTPPRSFAVGRSTCAGDSGAPALAESGAVLGVASLSVGECESPDVRNLFAQIRAHQLLVEDAFEAAARQPWYEGRDAPGSECKDCNAGGCSLVARPRCPPGFVGCVLFALWLALATVRARARIE